MKPLFQLFAFGVLLATVLAACEPRQPKVIEPKSIGVEKIQSIYWERQTLTPTERKTRLTLWADGRSEIMVVPDPATMSQVEKVEVKDGWKLKTNELGHYFVREPAFPKQEAELKFKMALAAGVSKIKPLTNVDGVSDQTLIGIASDDAEAQIAVPDARAQELSGKSFRTYEKVSRILSNFDADAFGIKGFEG